MPDLPCWQVQNLTVDLAEGMVRSLCSLVEYAPGNGKKVTLDWYVDCEIYKKHQYIDWGCKKGKVSLSSGRNNFKSKKRKMNTVG